MGYNRKKILDYWNREDVESMYDKHLLNLEIELIKKRIPPNSKVLDAGCGEGEGVLIYSKTPGVIIHAADFSETRLKKASERLKGCKNVIFKKVDFLNSNDCLSLDSDYDIIISQRFIINFTEWKLQCKVISNLMKMLKKGGRLLMMEGYKEGADSLNKIRKFFGLEPIPVRWHNLFISDNNLKRFMKKHGYKQLEEDGLGVYFLLTRGFRPLFERGLNWDCDFNKKASDRRLKEFFGFSDKFSRLKLWVFQK
ncbi:MAG: class I SAM-dependent methyltransferase [Candidatus Nitrosocaldus sp.]